MYVYGATRQVWVVKAAHHPLPCWRSGALPGLLWQGEQSMARRGLRQRLELSSAGAAHRRRGRPLLDARGPRWPRYTRAGLAVG